MNWLQSIDKNELRKVYSEINGEYEEFKSMKLNLDMTRGKPCAEQLNLSMGLFDFKGNDSYISGGGTDCRNYGIIDGIKEARELFAQMLEVSPDEIIIGGNSSLNLMYDTVVKSLILGVPGINKPWVSSGRVKFLCPSPGYDRHFAICEQLGIQMIPIDMNGSGPDMDQVEKLASSDESIKGIWCTPKYSNPEGITYSDRVVDRLSALKAKAEDFRIFWDIAYVVHDLTEKGEKLKNILQSCKDYGNPDRPLIFSSTSKITFPGAGVAMVASSEKNIKEFKKQISIQTIGPDKINQLRHVLFFKNMDNIKNHMKKHAAILKPKFDLVLDILEKKLGNKDIATWTKPKGGYFISLNTLNGCASKVVAKAAQAGLVMTKAGATYPYGKDPLDRNIRIAPTFPSLDELKKAMDLLCVCVLAVSIEQIIS